MRPLLPAVRMSEPAMWAPMATRFTGVQRFQPALATRARCSLRSTSAAAPFTPMAPISEPPNHAARPTSERERARVLRCGMRNLRERACTWRAPYPEGAGLEQVNTCLLDDLEPDR